MADGMIVFLILIIFALLLFIIMILNRMDTNIGKMREAIEDMRDHQLGRVKIEKGSKSGGMNIQPRTLEE